LLEAAPYLPTFKPSNLPPSYLSLSDTLPPLVGREKSGGNRVVDSGVGVHPGMNRGEDDGNFNLFNKK